MKFKLKRIVLYALKSLGMRKAKAAGFRPMPESAFKSVPAMIFTVIKEMKAPFALFQFMGALTGMYSIIWMFPFKNLLSTIENLTDQTQIWSAIAHPLAMVLFAWIFIELTFRATYFLRANVIRPDLEYIVTRRMFALLIDRKLSFFQDRPSAINHRINQLAEGVYDTTLAMSIFVIPTILGTVISIASLMFYNLFIGLIILLYTIIHVLIVLVSIKKMVRVSLVASTSHNIVGHKTLNIINNISSVKAFAAEKYESRKLNIFQSRRRETNRISLVYPERIKFLIMLNGFLTICVGLSFVQFHLYSKRVFHLADISFVFAFCVDLYRQMSDATDDIACTLEDIGRCQEAIDELKIAFKHTEFHRNVRQKGGFKLKNGEIIFSHVSFAHMPGKTLFDDQSITIKSKESVGLVGLSGSGKTTFVNLIMGYYTPTKGKITIGGQDTSKINVSDLRSHIAFMQQSSALFDRTIYENIKYGYHDATLNNVIKAAKMSHAHDFITELPQGYFTVVKDGGSIFSGGQKQRIALARTLLKLKDSPILILDEATSALDNHTQSILQKNIEIISKTKTTIVIAHKLTTVQNLDKILVFRDGKIVEHGSHKKLMSQKDSYYSYLWSLQSSSIIQ